MTLQVLFCLALPLLTCAQINYDEPVSAVDWAKGAGAGFSTNYFKSQNPMNKYNEQNLIHVSEEGFRNLRLRSNGSIHTVENEGVFNEFLDNLETVVDDCLRHGITPIVSWLHHDAEIHPSEAYRQQYVQWWTGVAERLKNKNYRVAFNLFTELGYTGCEPEPRCVDSIRENLDTYTNWTTSVVTAIRSLPGNNLNRTIILTSPLKNAHGLELIDPAIFEGDNNMLAEYHFYAAGPTKDPSSPRYWEGCRNEEDSAYKKLVRDNVKDAILPGVEWSKTNIPVYFGAWMTNDNKDGSLDQSECECFACFFAKTLGEIPWSLNVLDLYYDTKNSEWLDELQTVPKNTERQLNMWEILKKVKRCKAN